MSEEANNPEPDEGSQELAPEENTGGEDQDTEGTASDGDTSEESEDDGEGQGSDHPDADGHEEIELDGEKFLVPPKLKKELEEGKLRHDDYTRKTQALAEDRKAFDAQRAAREQEISLRTEAASKLREDIVKVGSLETQLKTYEKIDWRQAQAQIAMLTDPQERLQAQSEYNLAWTQFTALEREFNQAKSDLANKEQAFQREQTQRVQAAMQETLQTLAKEIPGFTIDYANKIVDHGVKGFGLTVEEARQMADPRIWKLIDSDRSKTAEIDKLKAENAKLRGQRSAQTANEAATKVRPAVRVGGGTAPPTGLSDKLPTDEWIRRRNAQVAKRRA